MFRRTARVVVVSLSLCASCHPAPEVRPSLAPARAAALRERSGAGQHEGLVVRVDPRVEVFSMLSRAAGIPPYAVSDAHGRTPYTTKVDAKLAELKDHPAVTATRRLAEEHGIGFDAPMSMAVHLSWPDLEPRVSLRPLPPALDDRWQAVDVDAYLADVRAFVRAADLERFFAEQQPYFERVESALSAFVRTYDDDTAAWFETFSGRSVGKLVLVQGLLTGVGNYAARVVLVDGSEEDYQVVVVWNADDEGVPRPGEELLAYVVHELAHNYVNPIVDEQADTLRPSAERLFAKVQRQMDDEAYGEWATMAKESLVRAATRAYLRDIGAEAALRAAEQQDVQQGFVWVGDLVDVLEAPLTRSSVRAAEVFDRHGR